MMQLFRIVVFIFLLFSCGETEGQEVRTVLRGKVVCQGRGVPYATLQLEGSSIGVASNDAGEYEMRVPKGREWDTVVVRSVGFVARRLTVGEMERSGEVRLEEQAVTLREVEVKRYRTAQHLLEAAVRRMDSNYCQQTGWSTFFYRDWRAVDGELFLFDEAVLNVKRKGFHRSRACVAGEGALRVYHQEEQPGDSEYHVGVFDRQHDGGE